MTRKFDFTDDAGHQQLHALANLVTLPDFVKQAASDVILPVELPSGSYADPLRRAFPCHTKAACYLSAAFLTMNCNKMPHKQAAQISSAIDSFASRHGISADVRQLQSTLGELQKTAAYVDPDDYAISWKLADGSLDCRYPLRNTLEIVKAAEYAVEHRHCFVYDDRRRMAEKILQKAASAGASLPAESEAVLRRQAGYGLCQPKEAAARLRERGAAGRLPAEAREILHKLAESLENNPLLVKDTQAMRDLAGNIDRLDWSFELSEKRSSALPYPEDFLFNLDIVKTAGEFVPNACGIATGAIYDKRQFRRLSPALIADAFGEKLANDVTTAFRVDPEKLAKQAAAMSLPEAQSLDFLMRQIGEEPRLIKSGGVGMTAEERKRAADEYAFAMSLPEPKFQAAPSGLG